MTTTGRVSYRDAKHALELELRKDIRHKDRSELPDQVREAIAGFRDEKAIKTRMGVAMIDVGDAWRKYSNSMSTNIAGVVLTEKMADKISEVDPKLGNLAHRVLLRALRERGD